MSKTFTHFGPSFPTWVVKSQRKLMKKTYAIFFLCMCLIVSRKEYDIQYSKAVKN